MRSIIAFILLLVPLVQASYLLYSESHKVMRGKYSYYYYAEVREEVVYKWVTYEGGKQVELAGCEVSPGVGILYGQTFKAGDFVYRCERATDYMSRIVPVVCAFKGRELLPGDRVPHGYFMYGCVQKGKLLVFEAVACLGDRGEQYGKAMKFTRGNVMYQCSPEGDRLIEKAVGCVINGKEVDVHRAVIVGSLWYKCARTGIAGVSVQLMGCVSQDGKRVDVGRTFRNGDFVYKCKARGSSIEIVLAGCVGVEMGQSKDFGFNSHWFARNVGPMGYMMGCVGNERQAAQEVTHCVVNEGYGRKVISVGCGSTYGPNKIFTCRKLRDGNIEGKLEVLPKGKSAFDAIATQHKCKQNAHIKRVEHVSQPSSRSMRSIVFFLFVLPILQARLLYHESYKVISGKYSYYYSTEVRETVVYKWVTYEGSQRVEAAGCEVNPGYGILYGEIFKAGEFVYRCDRGTEYMSRIVPIGCIFRGKELKPGDRLAHGPFVYSCVPRQKLLTFEAVACLDDKGKQYGKGLQLTRGNVLYKCMPDGDKLIQKAVGCVIAGKEVSVHKTISVGNIWYKCARAGLGGVEVIIMGCVSNTGIHVDVGRTFRQGGYVYKCKARGSSVGIALAGCVGTEMGQLKDFNFGARWFARNVGIIGYMMECIGNERQASQEISHCVVNEKFGRKITPVGCGTTYGSDKIFTCKRTRDGYVEGGLVALSKDVKQCALIKTDGQSAKIVPFGIFSRISSKELKFREKMHSTIAFILLLVPLVQASYLLYSESHKVMRGKYSYYYYAEVREEVVYKWVTYQQGKQVELAGCEVSPGVGILYGQTFKAGDFVYRCERATDYMSRIVPVVCAFKGRELLPGDRVPHGYFMYGCVQKGKLLVFEAVACLGDRGEQYGKAMKFTRGNVMYQCSPEGDRLIEKAVGCVINGKEVDVHRAVIVGSLWYKCARTGIAGVSVQLMGCVSQDGKRVDVGRTFRNGDFVYKCKARGSSIEIVLAGCVGVEMGQSKDFGFNSHWFARNVGPMGYMMGCVGNERQAAQEVTHCVVNEGYGRKVISVGCGSTYGPNKVFTCRKLRDGNIEGKLEVLPKGKSAFDTIASQHVRFC
ncbi:hypothetical protein M514_07066 [Trichuris suis]|uniref:Abnormal cell migration protein 18-like fibronectin type I domain-containing protein n=1 Tax=Trichuris suis TaxID=68888 RepID=A0A085N8Q0_9BILA|nr:hypothetical protein M514_07066 [Trichuris suis]